MLQVQNLRKTYDDRTVVNDVSFEVAAGEIFALLGPNGAGKTTLIRMITDILRPDSGTVTFAGRPLRGPDRARVAYLPEERGLYRRSGVLDTLAYFGELKGLASGAARREATTLLAEFGLEAWGAKQVQALSKGMQQKVQLCAALIGRPELLILDEPFSGLDPINVQVLETVLRQRRAEGTTVLLSTLQMNKVEQQCDRALMINRGHMVLYGRVAELRRHYGAHAFEVHAATRPPQVAGITSLEPHGAHWRATLAPEAEPQHVLAALVAQGAAVQAFIPMVPPLEDIFVDVVQRGVGLDQGQSGPPTIDEPVTPGGAR
jgi:ABC-2 type transport system ATP-binding protein